MKKAFKLEEIDAAVDKFSSVEPSHKFYVDFDELRGEFRKKTIFKILNVKTVNNKPTFNHATNTTNKTFVYLAGMPGIGKTSELAAYRQELHRSSCFFVVTCDIDKNLNISNMEYMDIVIYQLERLLEMAQEKNLSLDDSIIKDMEAWFSNVTKEINTKIKGEGSVEIKVEPDKSFGLGTLFKKLIGLTMGIKGAITLSGERSTTTRNVLRYKFDEFALKFNAFIEQTNKALRKQNIAQEILFIIDGLEKVLTAEMRKKVVIDDSNYIRLIRVNTIFTLPIELMNEEQNIRKYAEVILFPCIKIKERNGSIVEKAEMRLREMIEKRIDNTLIAEDAKENIIRYSGGSPRQLLRIIEKANWELEEKDEQIRNDHVEIALKKLSTETARSLNEEEFAILKKMNHEIKAGKEIGYAPILQTLIYKEVVLEYNNGTDKRINPILEKSNLFQQKINE